YRMAGRALDSLWLGRQFTSVAAVKHFLSTMRSATSETGLVERAERGISEIFDAPVRIEIDSSAGRPPDFLPALEAPLVAGADRIGVVRLGERANQVPFFSEDAALLGSLTDVFAYMLENMRLQRGRQEQ